MDPTIQRFERRPATNTNHRLVTEELDGARLPAGTWLDDLLDFCTDDTASPPSTLPGH
ncbi:MAG TPA: hypothetical protein VK335_22480 [Bryobacteraceae bacterium]|nr:hypothetical protein [Bryobacteraceae bacterium]